MEDNNCMECCFFSGCTIKKKNAHELNSLSGSQHTTTCANNLMNT